MTKQLEQRFREEKNDLTSSMLFKMGLYFFRRKTARVATVLREMNFKAVPFVLVCCYYREKVIRIVYRLRHGVGRGGRAGGRAGARLEETGDERSPSCRSRDEYGAYFNVVYGRGSRPSAMFGWVS